MHGSTTDIKTWHVSVIRKERVKTRLNSSFLQTAWVWHWFEQYLVFSRLKKKEKVQNGMLRKNTKRRLD